MRVVAFAPAKINLTLHVGRPYPDGRHPIESLAAFADVGDEIIAEPSADGGLHLEISGPFAGALLSEPGNLVLRAARLLAARKARGAERGARLTLVKFLPIASGIGGGSSDAAATMRVLDHLWGEPRLTLSELSALGAELGADVPVCVAAQSALMSGDGRAFAAIPLPKLDAVLVNPGVPAPTGAVYRAFDSRGSGDAFSPSPSGPFSGGEALLDALRAARNDLEAAALDVAPAIGTVLAELADDSDVALARMSGSGATCFGIVRDAPAAQRMANRLQARQPDWWVKAAVIGPVDAAPRPA
jgi:4-diphosphocytidyl-2-C-methyl-D-erythritol kinase